MASRRWRRLALIAAIVSVVFIVAGMLAVQRDSPVAEPSPSPTATATTTQTAVATVVVATGSPATPSPTASPSPTGGSMPGVTTHTTGWRPSGPTAIVQEFSYTESSPDQSLIAVPLDGSAPTRLVTVARAGNLSIRRDGSAVAFTVREGDSGGGRLAIWEVASGGARYLGPNEPGTASFNPVWSPDGESVFFGRSRGEEDLGLWHVRLDGSDLRQLVGPRTSDAPPTITIPHLVTEDGLLLWGRAYEGSSLEVLDLTTGRAASYGHGELFDWRADQPRALVGSCHLGCHGLVEWDDVSGSKREILSQSVAAQGADREPGGDRIAVAMFGPPWQLVLLAPDGSQQPAPGGDGAAWPHWVGDAIVYAWWANASQQIAGPPTELRSIPTAGGQPRTLYRISGPGRSFHVIDVIG